MHTSKDLNYRLYLQKTDGFIRTSFHREYERYADIREGNVEKVRENLLRIKKNYLEGKGTLSEDRIRNIRYHVIISVAMVSRSCVEGGMAHDVAYTLSDIYILQADRCHTEAQLLDLLEVMQLDFAERMHQQKRDLRVSLHIRRCIDYIYDHLDERLTVQELSAVVGLNVTYLAKLFLQETGHSVKAFVHHCKVEAAKGMLCYASFSCSEIALSLGFSSQSAFTAIFRKVTGMTPKKYRDWFGERGEPASTQPSAQA